MGKAREPLPGGERTDVFREGNVVRRPARPWTGTIHALLRYLETVKYWNTLTGSSNGNWSCSYTYSWKKSFAFNYQAWCGSGNYGEK